MKHTLLVAVEGGEASFQTAAYAAQACAGENQAGGRIVIFHVLPPLPPYVEGGEAVAVRRLAHGLEAQMRTAATRMLAEIRQRVLREGVKAEQVTTEMAEECGSVVEQIIGAAAAHGCDTIVVGRRGKSLLGEFLAGSLVEHLLWKPIGYTIWLVEAALPPKKLPRESRGGRGRQ